MLENAPTIIGLTGANGAGKDTVAAMLAAALRSHSRTAAMTAFADPLYAEVAQAFGVEVAQLKDRATKEKPVPWLSPAKCLDQGFVDLLDHLEWAYEPLHTPRSPRQILQWWGTQYRRAQDPLYWVKRFGANTQALQAEGVHHIIVSDVRFADEAAAIRTQGGQVWRVHRANYRPTGTGHVSEVTGEEFAPDATIHNTGSLDALRLSAWQTLFSSHTRAT